MTEIVENSSETENGELETIGFEDVNLQPGTKLQLLTHRGYVPVQYLSTFIGMESSEYLLVRLPKVQGSFLTFYDGEKITIRVFSGIMISSFDASVIQTFLHPLNCLCITFPNAIHVKKIRREMRIKVDIEANLGLIDGSSIPARLTNLSATGCQLAVDRDIGVVNDQMALNFKLSEDVPDIALTAKVRNIAGGVGSGDFLVGMEFVAVADNIQLSMRHYVYERLVERRQSLV